MVGNIRVGAGGKTMYDAIESAGRVATQGIYFDTGSDRIRPESSGTLKQIAAMLNEHAELNITIEGHTDNVGNAAANQALSEARARAVKEALVSAYGSSGGADGNRRLRRQQAGRAQRRLLKVARTTGASSW